MSIATEDTTTIQVNPSFSSSANKTQIAIKGSPYQGWLNNNTVKAGLGVDASVYYNDCVGSSNAAFHIDMGTSFAPSLNFILNSSTPKVKVIVMNGADDYIVNGGGVERYLRTLDWSGTSAWLTANKTVWWRNSTSQDFAWGTLKRYDSLTYADC